MLTPCTVQTKAIMMTCLSVFCTSLLATPKDTEASEVDSFTLRYEDFKDATPALNQETNRRIQTAIQKANEQGSCDREQLLDSLQEEFRRIFYGKFEGWVNSNPELDLKRIPLNKSVYRRFSFFENVPVRLGKMGFGAILKVNRHIIGTDKFGHFFDEGWSEYEIISESGSIQAALQYGVDTEEGLYGKPSTGVKSYGDMVANFNGAVFWSNVLGDGPLSRTTPYVSCVGGLWKQNVPFDWSDYVDGGWDEGVNCSSFRTQRQEALVKREVVRLGGQNHRNYQCPVAPESCTLLEKKYDTLSATLINPNCRAYFKNKKLQNAKDPLEPAPRDRLIEF